MNEGDSHGEEIPDVEEFEKRDKLAIEKEVLGLYVSDHPLSGRERQLATFAEMSIATFLASEAVKEGEVVTLAGLVTSAVTKLGRKSGKPYMMVSLEDFEAEIQMMLAGKTFDDFSRLLAADTVISVRGQVTIRDDARSLRVYDIDVIEGDAEGENRAINITIQDRQATRENIERLDKVLGMHPGFSPVVLSMFAQDGGRRFELSRRVRYSVTLASEIKGLFGIGALSQLGPKEPTDLELAGGGVIALEVEQGSLFGSNEPVDDIGD